MARKTEKPRLSSHTAALLSLGFTETEASLYSELLRNGPATGYRLAGAIGKAAPNVYQALEALFSKGAVMATEGRSRVFRATPVDEFLAALDFDFRTRRTAAQDALGQLTKAQTDDRLYQLKTVAQVLERSRIMIESAESIILHDLFPQPNAELTNELDKAARRGVHIAGINYPKIASTGRSKKSMPDMPWSRWPGQQITLVVDARETMFALLSPDGQSVLRGLWTNSVYVSCINHSGLACNIHIASTIQGRQPEPIASIGLLRANPPGLKMLLGEVSDAVPIKSAP